MTDTTEKLDDAMMDSVTGRELLARDLSLGTGLDDGVSVCAGVAVHADYECAGTGLVADLSAPDAAHRDQRIPVPGPVTAAEPACDRQHVPVSRVRAFARFNAVRNPV